jgi:hypothetical protein
MFIGEGIRQAVGKSFGYDNELGVPAVYVITGKTSVVAEIFKSLNTIFASPVGGVQPWDSYTISFFQLANASPNGVHHPDDLVSGNNGKFGEGQISFDSVKVSVADAAAVHANANLARPGDGHENVALY